MPVKVRYKKGDKRPYKLVNSRGKVEGTSRTESMAKKAAAVRNKMSKKK